MLNEMIEAINKEILDYKSVQMEGYDDIFDQFIEFIPDCSVRVVWKGEIDEHRWYGLQEIVWEIKKSRGEYLDEIIYVKNNVVTQSYSEAQSIYDIYHNFKEFKIVKPKEVTTIIYE